MILLLLRMRRNVNRNVFNDRKNVSTTPSSVGVATYFVTIYAVITDINILVELNL